MSVAFIMQSMRTSLVRTAPVAARMAVRTPVASAARVSVASVAPAPARTLTTSAVRLQEDRSWVEKGTVTYGELKPYTEHPDGVREKLMQSIDIIDVREPNEVAQGCIPASVNVPLSEFAAAFDVESDSVSSADFSRRFAFPRPEYDHKLIFYCRSGRRSEQALQIARERGWWKYVCVTDAARATTTALGLTGLSTRRKTSRRMMINSIHCPYRNCLSA